ncbi:MAG: hypothetical protein KIS61_09455 [Candidatus Eremiobacteraeota bacterium]|nr:hypothetical protein [Candidatus Eremiobacteraeota bacterium]
MAKHSRKHRPAPRESASKAFRLDASQFGALQNDLKQAHFVTKQLRDPLSALRSNNQDAEKYRTDAEDALQTASTILVPLTVAYKDFGQQVQAIVEDCVSLVLTKVSAQVRAAEKAVSRAQEALYLQGDYHSNVSGGANHVAENLLWVEADLAEIGRELASGELRRREVASAPGGTANPFPGNAQKRRDPASR